MESSLHTLASQEISKCKLLNTELSLVSSASGFYVKWTDSLGDKTKAVPSDAYYSNEIGSCGQLYPVQLNKELETAIFGNSFKSKEEERKSCVAALIVCENGAILAAHRRRCKVIPTLYRHSERTVWAGIVNDNETYAVVVVSREGTVHIAVPTSLQTALTCNELTKKYAGSVYRGCNLQWHEETIAVSPLVSLGHGNVIFTSDGSSSWLSVIKLSENTVEHKYFKLSYCGVIKVISFDNDCLELHTCDRRTYECKWIDLLQEIKSVKEICKGKPKEPFSSIEGIMTGIRHYSELMQREGKVFQDLDTYLNQLSLATSLLTEPQTEVFVPTVQVIQRFDQRNSYSALLSLKKNLPQIKLEGKWWELNVSVPGPDGKTMVSNRLDSYHFLNDICISIPLPQIYLNNSKVSIKIPCYLILGHYQTLQPVCTILACNAHVNIFHFLSQKHVINSSNTYSTDFNASVQSLALKDLSNASVNRYDKLSPPCQITLSFVSNDTNMQLFLSLLNINSTSNAFEREMNNNRVQLWYNDVPVTIQYKQEDSRVSVSISSSNPTLALSAKAAIERHVSDYGSVPSQVSIPSEVFQEAQQSCQILEFESCKATTPSAVAHLHQTTTKMLSYLPL